MGEAGERGRGGQGGPWRPPRWFDDVPSGLGSIGLQGHACDVSVGLERLPWLASLRPPPRDLTQGLLEGRHSVLASCAPREPAKISRQKAHFFYNLA